MTKMPGPRLESDAHAGLADETLPAGAEAFPTHQAGLDDGTEAFGVMTKLDRSSNTAWMIEQHWMAQPRDAMADVRSEMITATRAVATSQGSWVRSPATRSRCPQRIDGAHAADAFVFDRVGEGVEHDTVMLEERSAPGSTYPA